MPIWSGFMPDILARPLATLQYLVHPNLHSIGFQKLMGFLAHLRIIDLAHDDRHDKIALERYGDALSQERLAVRGLALESIDPAAAEKIGDVQVAARRDRRELRVEEVDVSDAIDLRIVDHAGIAVTAEAEFGPHIDPHVAVAPGAA